MVDLLPILLVIAAGLCLTLVLLALWHSLRGLLAHARGGPALASAANGARAALLREKEELLAAIHELRFEHELGKVSQPDFERLEQRYRARARDVLRLLDEQIAPHRERARVLLEQALAGAAPAPPPAAASACAQCGASNDADALFCKKCGLRLRDEAPA